MKWKIASKFMFGWRLLKFCIIRNNYKKSVMILDFLSRDSWNICMKFLQNFFLRFESEEGKNRNDFFTWYFTKARVTRNRYRFIGSLFVLSNSSLLSSVIRHGVCVHLRKMDRSLAEEKNEDEEKKEKTRKEVTVTCDASFFVISRWPCLFY